MPDQSTAFGPFLLSRGDICNEADVRNESKVGQIFSGFCIKRNSISFNRAGNFCRIESALAHFWKSFRATPICLSDIQNSVAPNILSDDDDGLYTERVLAFGFVGDGCGRVPALEEDLESIANNE